MHGTGDVESKDTAMLLRKTGLRSKGLDSSASDKALEDERQTFTREGEKEHGFTSSVVPTIEEKIVAEQPELHNGDAKQGQNGTAEQNGGPPEAQVDGQLYGVPANGDAQHDDKIPTTKLDDTGTENEKEALEARTTIRKHLSAKFGSKQWVLPTPTPHVDPHGFEDPVCDAFWKDVWLASAVHNVRNLLRTP